MAHFTDEDLSGASFERVDLTGSRFRSVDLSGSDFRGVELAHVTMRSVALTDVRIDGEVVRLVINGVDVAPLVESELNRREPERVLMRPTDVAGFRGAWDVIERRWESTTARARELEARDPALLHVSVEGEWSFIETLRHLAFATDAWIRRAVLGDPSPWHALDLPWDQMEDTPGVPRDREVRPTLDDALDLRRGRMATVRSFVDGLTDDVLAAQTDPVDGPGWPTARSFEVRECLLVVLNEEWLHRQFAERDLDVLEAKP